VCDVRIVCGNMYVGRSKVRAAEKGKMASHQSSMLG